MLRGTKTPRSSDINMVQYSSVPEQYSGPTLQQTTTTTKLNEHVKVNEKSVGSASSISSLHSPWRSGVWARFPFLALLALIFTAALAVMMVIVLLYSDTRAADWSITPSVLLAIAAALANLSLRFALDQGVILSWWTKALKPGTRLQDLHNGWAFGTNLKDALFAGPAFSLVALASIVVSLVPINGVLLQRASSITSTVLTTPFSLQIPIAQEFPDGYTGRVTTRGADIDILSSNFSSIVNQYNRNIPHNLTESRCVGQCSGLVQAAGYAINCNKHDTHFNMTGAANGGSGNIDGPYFFYTSFNFSRSTINSATLEQLNFTSVFKDGDTCAGEVHVANCTLVPAILQQHVILVNKTISLDPAYDYSSDKLVQYAPTTLQGMNSTHGGMYLFLSTRYNSRVETRFDGIYGLEIFHPAGSSQLEYMVSGHDVATSGCAMAWSDPTADMLRAARELAFRVALKAADPSNATNVQVMTSAVQQQTVLVYTSKFLFLGLALLFTLMGVVCVAPTLIGWWKLGRNVSMSPLELAKAFDAKSLADADSNADIGALLKEVGNRSIQYGIVVGDHTLPRREDGVRSMEGVLMLGRPGEVMAPHSSADSF